MDSRILNEMTVKSPLRGHDWSPPEFAGIKGWASGWPKGD